MLLFETRLPGLTCVFRRLQHFGALSSHMSISKMHSVQVTDLESLCLFDTYSQRSFCISFFSLRFRFRTHTLAHPAPSDANARLPKEGEGKASSSYGDMKLQVELGRAWVARNFSQIFISKTDAKFILRSILEFLAILQGTSFLCLLLFSMPRRGDRRHMQSDRSIAPAPVRPSEP